MNLPPPVQHSARLALGLSKCWLNQQTSAVEVPASPYLSPHVQEEEALPPPVPTEAFLSVLFSLHKKQLFLGQYCDIAAGCEAGIPYGCHFVPCLLHF